MRFTNLFVGYNKEEDFRILICAYDEYDALGLAEGYRTDSKLKGHFEIEEIENGIDNMRFDCDYVIA